MIVVYKLPDGEVLGPSLLPDYTVSHYDYNGTTHAGLRAGWCRETFSHLLEDTATTIMYEMPASPLVDSALVDIHGVIFDMKGQPQNYSRQHVVIDADRKLDAPFVKFLNGALTVTRIVMNPDIGNGKQVIRHAIDKQLLSKNTVLEDEQGCQFTPGLEIVANVTPMNGAREHTRWNAHDDKIAPIGSITNIPLHWCTSRPIISFITYIVRMWYHARKAGYVPYVCLTPREHLIFREGFREEHRDRDIYDGGAVYNYWGKLSKRMILPAYMSHWGRSAFWSFYYLLVSAAVGSDSKRREMVLDTLTQNNRDCNGFASFMDHVILRDRRFLEEQYVYSTLVKGGPTSLFDIQYKY